MYYNNKNSRQKNNLCLAASPKLYCTKLGTEDNGAAKAAFGNYCYYLLVSISTEDNGAAKAAFGNYCYYLLVFISTEDATELWNEMRFNWSENDVMHNDD